MGKFCFLCDRRCDYSPCFFKAVAEINGVSAVDATAYRGYATSCGTLICAVLAPLLGTPGDFKGMKKKLFTAFMLPGVISTFLLAATNGWQALLAFYIGTIGFSGSCIYYDSLLLDVTDVDKIFHQQKGTSTCSQQSFFSRPLMC